MSDLTPAQALGQPIDITLADGSTAGLRYSFRSLALLEQRFGSVTGIQNAIDQSGDGAAFGPLMDLIGAGLVGKQGGFTALVRHRVDAAGARTVEEIVYKRSSDGQELGDLLAPQFINEYADAMQTSLIGAFGTGSSGNDGAPVTTASPGLT
ncbi:hypothetical protein [Kitasatospora aureofaciens]|uniref:hypothetical protein n=1 Tax=Streptomyces phage mu1/6 TaxID=370623 RepID=UPI0000D4F6D9|nr:hypothetical protein SPMV1_gp43 [Streptomyces phage mu1/6]ABD94208.1 unknown [Streptomyces phage mu1/6]